jgi:light-regulated signal transduction histidine kinase (bacteriophytochrome)
MSSVATLQRDAELAPSEVPQYQVLSLMAHDLRQPLSNIEAIVYHLATILPQSDQKIQAHLRHIRELVQQTDEILSSSLREAALGAPLKQSAPPAEA